MSSSDSESSENMITLKEIETLAQLYQSTALHATTADKVKYKPNSGFLNRVSLYQGDITKLEVDAIVNAANRNLLGGGGVDGAIHAAAGPKLLNECRTLNGCLTGESKITKGYNLPARHVIHTVGPIYSTSDPEEKAEQLKSCYATSLNVAVDNVLRHVAFPSVSTGVYGYPIKDASEIALDTVRQYLESDIGNKLERIIFVVWSNRDKGIYELLIPEYFPPTEHEEGRNADAQS